MCNGVVGESDGLDSPRRRSSSKNSRRNGLGNYRSGAYNAALTNRHAAQDDHPSRNPNIRFDSYRRSFCGGSANPVVVAIKDYTLVANERVVPYADLQRAGYPRSLI